LSFLSVQGASGGLERVFNHRSVYSPKVVMVAGRTSSVRAFSESGKNTEYLKVPVAIARCTSAARRVTNFRLGTEGFNATRSAYRFPCQVKRIR
jgi:hypothetical protein